MTDDRAQSPVRSFVFGPFRFVPEQRLLLRDQSLVRVGGRAFDLLNVLVERAGELVGKRELIERVWPNVVVDEANLKVNMAALRRALNDEADAARYIATVTGRGYRFIATVHTTGSSGFASAPVDPRNHNLPVGATRIFGRDDAIAAIKRDLKESRLVSIAGPGGIGKTTVALAVAEQAIGSFKDGVWLVDLALQKDPDLVPNAVARAIGLVANTANVIGRLTDYLRDREMLLLLDNCEHVIEAASSCSSEILAATAGVRILVTSREPLLVKGERVRRLSGLGMPEPSAHLSAEDALAFPSIQLFVDRATHSLESFELRDADAPTIAEICRKLDGLALAIEIAATRVDTFGAAGLLRRLDDRFDVLVGNRAAPERQRTLIATLEWSYNLLSGDEATMLRAVSVFAGMFDIDGASAVANVTPVQAALAVAELVAKSLIALDVSGEDVAYRLPETTRAYGLERLDAAGESDAVRRRYAEHVSTVLERAESEWVLRPALDWGAAYGHLLDDLRGALACAESDTALRSLHVRLTVAGLLLWSHFSLTDECRVHVSRAAEELEAVGLTGTAFEMKLKMWLGGSTIFTRGLKVQAMEALNRALDIATRIGHTDYHLRCLIMMALYNIFNANYDAAMRALETFASVAAAQDPTALPEGEVHFAVTETFLGRLGDARQRLERLEQRNLRDVKDQRRMRHHTRYLSDRIVDVGYLLAHVQWLTGSPATAARTAEAAVNQALETGHHLMLANALSWVCPVFYWTGLYDACERHVEMLEGLTDRQGFAVRRPIAIFYRAALTSARHDGGADAVDGIKQAIAEFHATGNLARLPYYLSILADALANQGFLHEAATTIRDALDKAKASNERWCIPEILRIRASILIAEGKPDEAEAVLVESMTYAQAIGSPSWQLRSATDLSRLWNVGSRTEQARELLQPIYDQFFEGHETHDLRAAADVLRAST